MPKRAKRPRRDKVGDAKLAHSMRHGMARTSLDAALDRAARERRRR